MPLVLLAVLLAQSASAAPMRATVLLPVANMYSSPSTDADVVSQAIYGINIDCLEIKGDWAKIRTPDDYTGWVPLKSIKQITAAEREYAASGKTAWVQSLYSHLYREASVTKHQPVITVPFETRLEIINEPENDHRWLQVRLVDDKPAWIQRGDISFDNHKISIDEAISLSKRFLGMPYTWGGTSSFGYDCSGFTQMLCRRRGITLPRDAGPQARWDGMAVVDRKDLIPGDLLYFGGSLAKVSHTGMYIGNGQFIHSTTNTNPVVQISNINDKPWTEVLVACRRPK